MADSSYLNYHDKVNVDNTVHLRELIKTLPSFCRDFFLCGILRELIPL